MAQITQIFSFVIQICGNHELFIPKMVAICVIRVICGWLFFDSHQLLTNPGLKLSKTAVNAGISYFTFVN